MRSHFCSTSRDVVLKSPSDLCSNGVAKTFSMNTSLFKQSHSNVVRGFLGLNVTNEREMSVAAGENYTNSETQCAV
jgi:hypothetical protein